MKLWDSVRILDEQARCAIELNRMVLAKKTAKTVKTDEQEEPVVAE